MKTIKFQCSYTNLNYIAFSYCCVVTVGSVPFGEILVQSLLLFPGGVASKRVQRVHV